MCFVFRGWSVGLAHPPHATVVNKVVSGDNKLKQTEIKRNYEAHKVKDYAVCQGYKLSLKPV